MTVRLQRAATLAGPVRRVRRSKHRPIWEERPTIAGYVGKAVALTLIVLVVLYFFYYMVIT